MLLHVVTVLVGFLLLVWGADRFVVGAAATANNLGVSPLLIGLIIVGFGTSAPEILVSVNAALDGSTGLAIGNAVGSNIANIGLILGTTAVVIPLTVTSRTLRRELPVLLAVTMLALLPMFDGQLDRIDGVGLILGLGLMMYWLIRVELTVRKGDPMVAELEAEIRADLSMAGALMWLGVGLVVLLISARGLVWGAVGIAEAMGISDLVIGLTIVAIGTSLPELAASIAAAIKNEHDLAVGNVIGSNMYNLLAVLGIAGIINPAAFPEEVIQRDFPVMIALTVFMFAIAYDFKGREGRVTRSEGFVLLGVFVAYQLYVITSVL